MLDTQALEFLEKKLSEYPSYNYPVSSRIHPLNQFPKGFFVKREDELGFGISGCKFRKYRTLFPYLQQQGYKEIVVVGSAFSNHVLSITQLIIENGLQPTLFVKGPKPTLFKGNFLFLETLLPQSSFHWISKEEWPQLSSYIDLYMSSRESIYVIPEGAALFPAFIGALTLPLDIIRNEQEMGISFHHIYMEVGTGYSACALLLGLAFLKKKSICHLLHVADTEKAFTHRLQYLHGEFSKWLEMDAPFPEHVESMFPTLAPSFGSTNKKVFQFIAQTAREEGFFLDPIYSAKLFYEVRRQYQDTTLPDGENALIIHSGGALTLAGFQEQLHASLFSKL